MRILEKPLVSVIIPTYNRARLLPEALNSVLSQEGAGELFAMEVIVADDASSDNTADIVRGYPGVRYVRLEVNRGECGARNEGIKASRGTYLAFLDDDDQWLVHKLKVQVPVLENHPEVGLVYGQSVVLGNGRTSLSPQASSAPSGNVFRALLMKEFMSVNTPLIRREAFQKAGDFDETLPRGGMPHYDMFLRLAFHVPFVFLPGAVAVGHVNAQGLFFTHLGGQNGYANTAPAVVEKNLSMLRDSSDYAQVRREVLVSLIHRLFSWLGSIEGADRMRSHLLAVLKAYPWILTDESVGATATDAVAKVAIKIAAASETPIRDVRNLLEEVRLAAHRPTPADWPLRRIEAEVWTRVSGSLKSAVSHTAGANTDRVAARAAACAVFTDPAKLKRKQVLKHLVRGVFPGPRWDPAFVQLTKALNRFRSGNEEPLPRRQEWSIGIYVGTSPLELSPPANAGNPVLTRHSASDVRAHIIADPFMVNADDTWYMFFEVLNRATWCGEIGLATSRDGLSWAYQQIVLTEPFHLSYPYVFQWQHEYYMIPETYQTGCIRLYKATRFPTHWSFARTLVSGRSFADSSVFRHGGKWWLFTETSPDRKDDTLRLYYADDVCGPWREHPNSPIIAGDARVARPGGRVVEFDGTIVRYAQDCYPTYGTRLRAFEITELSTTSYRERAFHGNPVLTASGTGWNADGMHHMDPHRLPDGSWIACVDGWCHRTIDNGTLN